MKSRQKLVDQRGVERHAVEGKRADAEKHGCSSVSGLSPCRETRSAAASRCCAEIITNSCRRRGPDNAPLACGIGISTHGLSLFRSLSTSAAVEKIHIWTLNKYHVSLSFSLNSSPFSSASSCSDRFLPLSMLFARQLVLNDYLLLFRDILLLLILPPTFYLLSYLHLQSVSPNT